jgi:hypothetical protein
MQGDERTHLRHAAYYNKQRGATPLEPRPRIYGDGLKSVRPAFCPTRSEMEAWGASTDRPVGAAAAIGAAVLERATPAGD